MQMSNDQNNSIAIERRAGFRNQRERGSFDSIQSIAQSL
jgi:hypothetical protein